MKTTALLFLAAAAALAACRTSSSDPELENRNNPGDPTDPYGPSSVLSIGNIDASGISTRVIVGPDTVRAGQSVSFTINTFGSSCLRPESTAVVRSDRLAVLTPYDRSPGPNFACTADYGTRPHPVTLSFPTAGSATIRVRGMMYAQGGSRLDSLTRTITVLP